MPEHFANRLSQLICVTWAALACASSLASAIETPGLRVEAVSAERVIEAVSAERVIEAVSAERVIEAVSAERVIEAVSAEPAYEASRIGDGAAVPSNANAVKITPSGITEKEARLLDRLVLDLQSLKRRVGNHPHRLIQSFHGENRFHALVYDYVADELLELRGSLDHPEDVTLRLSEAALPPTVEELEEAFQLVRKDPRFEGALSRGDAEIYPAMPPVLPQDSVIDQPFSRRTLSIGMRPAKAGTGFAPEIVGVDLKSSRIIRFPGRTPKRAIVAQRVCGYDDAGQYVTGRGTAGQALITWEPNGQRIWQFTVARPAASSGEFGSGVDISEIFYKGKRVLSRLHTPIVNVQYISGRCGPYRDWLYEENAFMAQGAENAPGILSATARPTTVFDSGNDTGNFRGVAVHRDGSELVVVTEISAGWHRYRNEYRFHDDGTISPRWGFSSVEAACTCLSHIHHVYWRMDFEVGADEKNHVQVLEDGQWRDVATESRFARGGRQTEWRVLDAQKASGYAVVPGMHDGKADAYGKGDLWALTYGQYETDDRYVRGNATSIQLDSFVNGQSVSAADSVLWYGAHFLHQGDDGKDTPHMVGPSLRPHAW